MKRTVYNYAMLALMAAMTMTLFNSCMTEDEEIAYDLSGEWEGYMGEDYYSYWGYEGGRNYDTCIRFYRQGSSSYRYGDTYGSGEQIDYAPGYGSRYRSFNWEVYRGEIRLSYSTGEVVYIYDYSINGSRFSGYMDCGRSKEIRFELYKTTNFDWDYYHNWSQTPNAMNADSLVIEK